MGPKLRAASEHSHMFHLLPTPVVFAACMVRAVVKYLSLSGGRQVPTRYQSARAWLTCPIFASHSVLGPRITLLIIHFIQEQIVLYEP